MSMVHDNVILAYEVDLQHDQIILHTTYEGGSTREETNIVFKDVLNHRFEHQLKGSIILDIVESDISHFIKDNLKILEESKNYGWPIRYHSISELEKKITDESYKYIEIMSSYGLSGWVLAKSYEVNIKDNM